jgi:hypothetical protein
VFLNNENNKDIKVALKFSKFLFFGYTYQKFAFCKRCLEKKIKKHTVFSHFLSSFQECYMHYFDDHGNVLFFLQRVFSILSIHFIIKKKGIRTKKHK